MLSSRNNASRMNCTLSAPGVPPLPQCLRLEPITLGFHKYTLSGGLRRVLNVPPGSISEYHPVGVRQSKPTPPVAIEGLKNFKDELKDASEKARDRVKILQDSIFKLDKYRELLNSKKRRRTGFSSSDRSSEANLLRLGSTCRKPHEHLHQKLEDKPKAVEPGLKRHIRVSMLDARAESSSGVTPKQQVVMEKVRDVPKSSGAGDIQIEEKTLRLAAGDEGWDKNMKRKQSGGAVGNRTINTQRDTKQHMHPTLSTSAKFQSVASGFRSRSSSATSGLSNSEEICEPANLSSCPKVKIKQIPSSWDYTTTKLEERTRIKGTANQVSIHDAIPAGSPSIMIKGKVSTTSRTDSVTIIDSFNVHPSSATLTPWEQPTGGNKTLSLHVTSSHMQSVLTDASAHHTAKWIDRRPLKISRTGRPNFVSNNNEFSYRIPSQGASGSLLASSSYSKFKIKVQNFTTPQRLSEVNRTGEKWAKEQGADAGEAAENGAHKAEDSIRSSKKNKALLREEAGEEVQDQRSGSLSSSIGSIVLPTRKKVENLPKPKPSTRQGLNKNRSKLGCSPSKKLMNSKVSIDAGHVLNSCLPDFTGEVEDQEELLAVANSSRNASKLACSGPFWKKVDCLFASVTSEDASFLKRKQNLAEEMTATLSQMFGDEHNALGMNEVPVTSEGRQPKNSRIDKVPSMYQRVLSALIEEDGSKEISRQKGGNVNFQCTSAESHCGSYNNIDVVPKEDRNRKESEWNQNHCLSDGFSSSISASSDKNINRGVSSLLCNNEQCKADDGLSRTDGGIVSTVCQNDLGLQHSSQDKVSAVSSFDCQHKTLSVNDKLLVELQSIGLYPETMPTLAEGEGVEKLDRDIMELQAALYQQAGKIKKNLANIGRAIERERDSERRNMEQLAMNQLVEMAYKRMTGSRGGRSSGRKVPKQLALAFVKRTLARCRKFETTGRSCFSEPGLRDVISPALASDDHAKFVDCVGSRTALKIDSRIVGAQQLIVNQHGLESRLIRKHVQSHLQLKSPGLPHLLLESLDHAGSASSKAVLTSNSTYPSLGSFWSDRKSKPKPVQTGNHLPTSGNRLHDGGTAEATNPVSKSAEGVHRSAGMSRVLSLPSPDNPPPNLSKKADEKAGVSNLQPNQLDNSDLGIPNDFILNQDLWLDFEVDALQDEDSIGLDIPMDDLNDVCL